MNIEAAKEKQNKITQIMMEGMGKIQKNILQIKRVIASSKKTEAYYWQGLRKKLKKEYEKASSLWGEYAKRIIPLVYKTKVYDEADRIQKIKTIFQGRKIKIQAAQGSININDRYHKNTIAILINDLGIVMDSSLDAGFKYVSGLLSQTQQQVITEAKINQSIVEGLREGGTVRAAQDRIYQALVAEVGEDFIIKAGSKRFTLSYYAEMVARTKIREAQTQAVIGTALDVGSDLIQVSSHNTTTAICIPYEGRVYSISGRDKDFPPLMETTPFHPNCLHSVSVIFKEVIEQRGKLKEYSDFSYGKTEIHPTRKSHIPISQREVA